MDINTSTGELFLYDAIGPEEWGMIGAKTVNAALQDLKGKRPLLRINSPGGSVDEGIAILNALTRHPGGVDVAIDSVAASAASFIAMAGQRITIAKNATVMIHEPWGLVMGNAADMRKYADLLDLYSARILSAYTDRTKQSADQVKAWLAAETWFTADQAVANGFADAIDNASPDIPANMPSNWFKNPPTMKVSAEFPNHLAARMKTISLKIKNAVLPHKQ